MQPHVLKLKKSYVAFYYCSIHLIYVKGSGHDWTHTLVSTVLSNEKKKYFLRLRGQKII